MQILQKYNDKEKSCNQPAHLQKVRIRKFSLMGLKKPIELQNVTVADFRITEVLLLGFLERLSKEIRILFDC